MTGSRNFARPLAQIMLTGFIMAVSPAIAASEAQDCPVEPTLDVIIQSGNVFSGPNCTISPVTDLDSFEFSGTKDHVYRAALSLDGGGYPNNVCLDLWVDGDSIKRVCSDTPSSNSAVLEQTLPVTGWYTLLVTESGNNATAKYALTLERLFPAAPDSRLLSLPAQSVSDEINPLTDMDLFRVGAATTGTFRVTATITAGGYPKNLCFDVVSPDGVIRPEWRGCTDTPSNSSVSRDITPALAGMHVIAVRESGYDSTVGYTLNVQCLFGTCGWTPPCVLTDTLSYSAGTLTMNFTVGHKFAARWNAWLVSKNAITPLWSTPRPITDPPVKQTRTLNLTPVGRAGVLSTLTTPVKGIVCHSWVVVNTGSTPGTTAEPNFLDFEATDEVPAERTKVPDAVERERQRHQLQ